MPILSARELVTNLFCRKYEPLPQDTLERVSARNPATQEAVRGRAGISLIKQLLQSGFPVGPISTAS